MNILWEGARGPTVQKLQAKLKDVGFDPGDMDGVFGSSMTKAVTAFQKDRKLFADGIAGPQTLDALDLAHPLGQLGRVIGGIMGRPRPNRTRVFVSYSHNEEKWLQMLQIHLTPLERSGIAIRWDDTRIASGQKWQDQIAVAIRSAKVAVLLISPQFMASEFIAKNELPSLLDAAEHEGLVILPVIISPCVMGTLAKFQAVNSPTKPLVDLGRGDRDRVWVKVVEAITAALND